MASGGAFHTVDFSVSEPFDVKGEQVGVMVTFNLAVPLKMGEVLYITVTVDPQLPSDWRSRGKHNAL